MKKLTVILIVLVSASATQAQDRPYRLGVKLGLPNIFGLNAEYVTPLLDGKLAGSIDFSKLSLTVGAVELDYRYFEFGANYYFVKDGEDLTETLALDR
ncbi:MAG: hypothetical protein AAF361_11505 [Bacteroidota bacterium]